MSNYEGALFEHTLAEWVLSDSLSDGGFNGNVTWADLAFEGFLATVDLSFGSRGVFLFFFFASSSSSTAKTTNTIETGYQKKKRQFLYLVRLVLLLDLHQKGPLSKGELCILKERSTGSDSTQTTNQGMIQKQRTRLDVN